MNIALWIITSVLAAVFLAAGSIKLVKPQEELAASGMGSIDAFPPGLVKAIGALEVLAAVGLVLPAVLDIAPVLVPLAALGVVLLMAGAALTHLRRTESQMVVVNAVLLIVAAGVAWGRSGPYPL